MWGTFFHHILGQTLHSRHDGYVDVLRGEKGRGGVAVHVLFVSCVRLCRADMYSTSEPYLKFWQMTECRSKWVSLESPEQELSHDVGA